MDQGILPIASTKRGSTPLNPGSELELCLAALPTSAEPRRGTNPTAMLRAGLLWTSLLLGGCCADKAARSPVHDEPSDKAGSAVAKDNTFPIDPKTHSFEGAHYPLSGGGLASVYKPFGPGVYAASVRMDGEYPEPGKVGRNFHREELIVVLQGEFEVLLNNERLLLSEGQNFVAKHGDTYALRGQGICFVLVRDGEGGMTEIVPKQ